MREKPRFPWKEFCGVGFPWQELCISAFNNPSALWWKLRLQHQEAELQSKWLHRKIPVKTKYFRMKSTSASYSSLTSLHLTSQPTSEKPWHEPRGLKVLTGYFVNLFPLGIPVEHPAATPSGLQPRETRPFLFKRKPGFHAHCPSPGEDLEKRSIPISLFLMGVMYTSHKSNEENTSPFHKTANKVLWRRNDMK